MIAATRPSLTAWTRACVGGSLTVCETCLDRRLAGIGPLGGGRNCPQQAGRSEGRAEPAGRVAHGSPTHRRAVPEPLSHPVDGAAILVLLALLRAFLPAPVAQPAIPDAFLWLWSRRQCWLRRQGTYYFADRLRGVAGPGPPSPLDAIRGPTLLLAPQCQQNLPRPGITSRPRRPFLGGYACVGGLPGDSDWRGGRGFRIAGDQKTARFALKIRCLCAPSPTGAPPGARNSISGPATTDGWAGPFWAPPPLT